MEIEKLVAYGLGALFAVVAMVVFMVRSRSVNREDPLQRRLANHLTTYAHSVADDAALARLKADLKAEFKARSVPREEWDFRVASASGLVDPNISRERCDILIATLTRLKLS